MNQLASASNKLYGETLLAFTLQALERQDVLTRNPKLSQWQSKQLDWSTYKRQTENFGTPLEKHLDEQTVFYDLLDKYNNGVEPLSNWTTEDLIKLMDAIDAELQDRAPPDSEYT